MANVAGFRRLAQGFAACELGSAICSNASTMPWHIYHDGSNRWRWERLDRKHKVLARSIAAFESREECLKDAQYHGYSGKHGGPMDHGADEANDC